MVSTFAGESCFFGEQDVFTGWENQFTQHPDLAGKIHFVPSFFIDIQKFQNFSNVLDGDFNVCGTFTPPFRFHEIKSCLSVQWRLAP